MQVKNTTIEYQTKEELEIIDITQDIERFVKESDLKNGLVNIQSLHTTLGLILNENEPLLIEDIKRNLNDAAGKNMVYSHDDFKKRTINLCDGECVNGYAHCRAIHLPSSLVLNLINGQLQLGQWQRVLMVELDRAKKRKIQIQIIGE